ncbi:NAD-dependent epimerase/dehydratase family protein [Legionella erythra]|uniref:Protein capI n=1 Tax=Legionella erythra TaxID=448 RepID=A0A0W0TRR7_LEGER|nr:NAD-dependent epimerase/dehydratase family protein [Legionella erythra]KTC98204.1 protein capI [Legionella erythra]
MKKVLVTGGMGFIGNHLVHRLLKTGVEVIILDKNIDKPRYYDVQKAKIIEGDVLSKALLHDLLKEVDTCFHLAALASIALCERDWLYSHANNALAFNFLLDEIRVLGKETKLVYASSAAVYGDCQTLPLDEKVSVHPVSNYGCDKLCNELYAGMMSQMAGIHATGLRFFNVYGPGQQPSNPYSGVMSQFKQAILTQQNLMIYGDGLQTRDFIYVDDVVDALILAADIDFPESTVFNICSGEAVTIESLARLMLKLTHYDGEVEYLPARASDLLHSLGKTELAQKRLGFKAKTNIEDGLKKFLNDSC